jgi:hypothetical protein
MKHRTFLSVLILLSLVLIALPAPMAAQPGVWQYGPPTAPDFEYQRFDGAFVPGPLGVPWANKVYFMGGRIGAPIETPEIWMLDPVAGVYTYTGADMIEDVSNYNADLILDDGTGRGPAVYVVGGYDKDYGSGGGGLGMVQRYYPMTNEIEALPSVDDWPGQVNGYTVAGMGSAVVDDIIHVFGGWESNVAPYFNTGTWAFDPTQPSGSRWTYLVAMGTGRAYIQTAVQDGKIYAMGGISGYDGADLIPTNAVEVLDTANPGAGWSYLASMPVALAEGRGFGFDVDTRGTTAPGAGYLYTVGGGDWPDYSTEVMEYEIASDTWDQAFPDLNVGRVNEAGSFIPLCTLDADDGLPGMWVFGGRSLNGCDPPYAPTEFYAMPCVCAAPASTTLWGPAELLAGEWVTYSLTLEPYTTTLPITVEWSSGMTGTSAVYGWDEPGEYTILVTATNCSGAVQDTLDVTVLCVGLTTATVSGPEMMLAGETGIYSATLEPPDATEPVDLIWSNGMTSTSTTYSWPEPGAYTVVVTATNCDGTAVVSDALTVAVLCVEVSEATISGPEELLVGATGTYSVALEPPNATEPMALTWSNGITGTSADFTWAEPGTHTVVVTATNCGGAAVVTGTLEVAVTQPLHAIYLPIIVKNQ